MATGFTDVLWPDGQDNMGGLQTIAYYAPIADIATFPSLPAVPTSNAELVTISDSFVMKTGKFFHQLYGTQETQELQNNSQGELDGRSFAHKADLTFPSNNADSQAFITMTHNSNMVVIVVEANGQKRIVGSAAFPAKFKNSAKTGKKTADKKEIMMEVTSYGNTPTPIYTGDIPLS